MHHQNLRGPILSVTWFDLRLRVWVLSVFCDRQACFRQYYDYTFTERFGIWRPLAAVLAWLASFVISALMWIIRAIPVYRASRDILQTFHRSVAALAAGENILICPDVEYTDTSAQMGQMYEGFLQLERFYYRETGQHVAFIPLHIPAKQQEIRVGEAIYFQTDNFRQERSEVLERLEAELARLEAAG